jgi:hypothetical protein
MHEGSLRFNCSFSSLSMSFAPLAHSHPLSKALYFFSRSFLSPNLSCIPKILPNAGVPCTLTGPYSSQVPGSLIILTSLLCFLSAAGDAAMCMEENSVLPVFLERKH